MQPNVDCLTSGNDRTANYVTPGCHCLEELDRYLLILRELPLPNHQPKPRWMGRTSAEVVRSLIWELVSDTACRHLTQCERTPDA